MSRGSLTMTNGVRIIAIPCSNSVDAYTLVHRIDRLDDRINISAKKRIINIMTIFNKNNFF